MVHSAGKDLDAYCGRCKLELSHRILAMDGTHIHRVRCLTCNADHAYRRAPSQRASGQSAPGAKRKTATKKTGAYRPYGNGTDVNYSAKSRKLPTRRDGSAFAFGVNF